MVVRKVSGRGGNMIGRFPSLKMGRMIAFESLIEQDYLFLLDFEPDVLTFTEQPVQIEYFWEGKERHYTPDFHVARKTGEEIVECKPLELVHSDENQRKFKIAREWCQSQGWSFHVVTDDEIRTGTRLNNVKLLTRHARLSIPPGLLRQVQSALQEVLCPCSLHEVARVVLPDDVDRGISVLLHLAYHHQIELRLDQDPITSGTMIQLGEYFE